jgi:amidase
MNNTEITNYETLVSPDGWNWDYGTTRGYPNESEYTYVKIDFYNNINRYLSDLSNTNIRTIDNLVQYNFDNDGTEGGNPYPLGIPAFHSGQDGLLASQATNGKMNETYFQALEFCQTSTRKGINDALNHNGMELNGLLVPPDVGQSYQIAAQAGYPVITIPAGVSGISGMPFGLAIMQTAWGEAELIKWASAIEDLQLTTKGNTWRRTLPAWRGYLERNIPVPFTD